MRAASAEDDFLSALSFQDAPAAAVSGQRMSPSPARHLSTSPTLHSMLSGDTFHYPAEYPSAFYSVQASPIAPSLFPAPPPTSGYGYGAWRPPTLVTTHDRCNARTDAAVSAAEKQRQMLKLEVDLAEEQRRRLSARLSSSSRHASTPSVSPDGVNVGQAEATAQSDEDLRAASEEALTEREVCAREATVSRGTAGGGVELEADEEKEEPPPWSPSPPSAHAGQRRAPPKEASAVSSAVVEVEMQEGQDGNNLEGQDARGREQENIQPVVERFTVSPSPSPSPVRELRRRPKKSEKRDEENGAPTRFVKRMDPQPTRPSPSPSLPAHDLSSPSPPRNTAPSAREKSRQEERLGASPSPSRLAKELEDALDDERATSLGEKRTPLSPLKRRAAASLTRGATVNKTEEEEEEEEKLYAAYQQKLARIQQALRASSYHATPHTFNDASWEARIAYEQRRRVGTPTLASLRSAAGGFPSHIPPPLAHPIPSPAQQPIYAGNLTAASRADAMPLVCRAPSLSTAATAAGVDSRYIGGVPTAPQLRFDLTHSGNVLMSPDGFVCRSDAAEALARIEDEYADRLSDVLPRLVIPFYALGDRGVTRGSLFFSFRWFSPPASRRGRQSASRPPALAFGFATRAFTGYGSDTPAFLYLSSGAIAQGVRGAGGWTGPGEERPYGAPYSPGLELSARLDLESGELEFYVEAVSMGVAFCFCPARHPAPLYPVVVFSAEGDTAELLYSA